MAQTRQPTLRLWRFFLDLCLVLEKYPAGVSSHQVATELQGIYKAMWQGDPHSLARHFGELPEVAKKVDGDNFTFPSQATVLRYIKEFEKDLQAFFPGKQLIPRAGRDENATFQKPNTRDVQLVRHIGQALFKQLEKLKTERRPIDLAASDSVSSFLLPDVNVFETLGDTFYPRIQKFVPSEVTRALLSGDWDVAIAWDNGYGVQPVGISPNINSAQLQNSECHVRLLVHPNWRPEGSSITTRNPIAARKRDYIKEHGGDGFDFAITPEYLLGARLVYPDLPQVARIGEEFVKRQGTPIGDPPDKRKVTKGYQLDHFSTVVNAVRMNNGIALIPGWPWLCRTFENQHNLITVGLRVPTDWNVNTKMALRSYTRNEDLSNITREETVAARTLLGAIEGVLTKQYFDHDAMMKWKLAGRANAAEKMFAGKQWQVWFVTGGKYKDAVGQRWMQGTITFDAKPGKDRMLAGKLHLTHEPSKVFMDVALNPKALDDKMLMLRFRREATEDAPATQTSAYFPARVARDGSDGATHFLGSLSYEVEEKPFCAPILLSDRPLEISDCRNIARGHLIDMLHGDEPDVQGNGS